MTTKESDPPVEVHFKSNSWFSHDGVAFSANGEYFLSGGSNRVQIWRVEDGKQMARLDVWDVHCFAVSQDGRWIAGGTHDGAIFVWDAETYEQVLMEKLNERVNAVDFSPDSTRLVAAPAPGMFSGGRDATPSVWDIATGKQVQSLEHYNAMAATYSPQGDRIATANVHSGVRIWDSNDGHLILDIKDVDATKVLWQSNDHLFVHLDRGGFQKIDASTGATVHDGGNTGRIAMPKHGEFITHIAGCTITFLDTSTHTWLGCIQHPQEIHSVALSLDAGLLAIGDRDGTITIKNLSHFTYGIPLPHLYPSLQEPDIRIDDAALDLWKRDQLWDTEALLTTAIATPQSPSHHALASRAIVRARLRQWDAAVDDAEKSIKTRPSVIGYIAKSVALVGKGEKHKAYRACDMAFGHSQSSPVRSLLLIKAIIVFMAGEHNDAISRVDDVLAIVNGNSICCVVQAYMYLLLGNLRMESRHYESAIRLFERAQAKMPPNPSQGLLLVSLMTGWKFDHLGIRIRQHLCEALYAASRAKQIPVDDPGTTIQHDLCEAVYAASRAQQAGESLIKMTHLFNEEVYSDKDFTRWVSDFTQRCLAMPESSEFMQRYPSTRKSDGVASSKPSPLLNEWARATLMVNGSWTDALSASLDFIAPRPTIYRAICEGLERNDYMLDARKCFLQMVDELAGETTTHREQAEWVVAFREHCAGGLECLGDVAADARDHDDAITKYSAALSLDLPTPRIFLKRSKVYIAKGLWEDALHDANQIVTLDPTSPWGYEKVLMEWAKVNLTNGLWKGVLCAARDFNVQRLMTYRILCEGLETAEGIMDASECFREMADELTQEAFTQGEQGEWFRDFKCRCFTKLECLGDVAIDSQRHDEALGHYSAALSIHPINTPGFFILQCKVCMAKGSWEDAIDATKQAIALDPSSPRGYEVKRTALHGAGRYDDAIQTFETMLSKMARSTDPQIREHRDQYVHPSSTLAQIRKVVQRTIRHSPRVLINTSTGCLQNKAEQAAAFMSLPVVNKLVSSMTTRIDRGRIKHEVKQFFRYVMLSHKWEENEPLFQQVIHLAVYDLCQSPTHDKLQTFCRIVRDAGFNWAWNDTCCINKEDHFVLQEALVAMFKWYRGSVMTIVYLRGVYSSATLGDLVKSIWNTRAWTLQEYVAARVIRFYTEDWTPYLNLDMSNHKESSEIMSEMEEATGVPAQQLKALRPGLSSIREKLRLASTRQTTMVEDAAYSLLGIFSVTGIPAIYGEGEGALGRLLAHILAGSGDASILAWTGQSGASNSCLPAHITVFNGPASSHVPPPIEDAEMDSIITTLRSSTLDLDLALKLHDQLHELPAPWFAANRMKLPCIAFKLPPLSFSRTVSGCVYHAETPVLGMVEIKTKQDLSRLDSLYLVHPWLDALLGREDIQSGVSVEDDVAEPSSPNPDDEDVSDDDIEDDASPRPEPKSPSHPAPTDTAPADRETRALQLVARLRQPFGALLFTLASTRRRAVEYKRVAADSIITVQIQENVPLTDVLDNVRTLDVL